MQKINNFTVLESIYGKFIVNRHSTTQADFLVKTGIPHTQAELALMSAIIESLPDFCVVVDAGANAGLIGVPIAQAIKPRGGIVLSFEPQRMIYNAHCGTVALNDLDNMLVHHKAVGATAGKVKIPLPDYGVAQDFGQLSLVGDIGDASYEMVEMVAIDGLNLPRLDFLKIDVEGMEIDVLKGAQDTIRKHLPWCWVEHWKIGIETIAAEFAGLPYQFHQADALNLLCAPEPRLAETGIKLGAPGTKPTR